MATLNGVLFLSVTSMSMAAENAHNNEHSKMDLEYDIMMVMDGEIGKYVNRAGYQNSLIGLGACRCWYITF
jgi:hypothetical protein